MYINRKDALDKLRELSREPYYQHDGEDYYVGIAEATGEIYSMPSIEDKTIISEALHEIVERIKNEVLETLSDDGSDWYACSKVWQAIDIINEYT